MSPACCCIYEQAKYLADDSGLWSTEIGSYAKGGILGKTLSIMYRAPLLAFCCYAFVGMAVPCAAQSSPSAATPDKAALMNLARQYVDKMDKAFNEADNYLAGMDPEDIRVQPYFDAIPDGEIMVLQLRLKRSATELYDLFYIEEPVMGIKQKRDVMLSLNDFVTVARFSVRLDPETGRASGWFIREDNRMELDATKPSLSIAGKDIPINKDDILFQDGDVFVRSKVLAQWFGFNVATDPQTQTMSITTKDLWPIQQAFDRYQRKKSKGPDELPAQPFVQDEYETMASFSPTLDVFLRQTVRKSPDAPTQTQSTYSVQGVSDLLGFTARSTISGDKDEPLNNVTLNFSRLSENADLLGPLKARFFEFNDVTTASLPLAGNSAQERGVHVTNKNPYITYDTTTQIEGMAPPGWDVELYRNEQYIDGVASASDGRYSFDKVLLFAGDNRFRIVQFGPQGERREEERTFSVVPKTFGGGGLYDVSLTQQNTQTYTVTPSIDEDKNTPNLVGTYEMQLTPGLALRTGIQAVQEDGEQHQYGHVGAVTVVGETIVNADAVLTSMGPYSTALTARRNLGAHSLSVGASYGSEDYNPGGSAESGKPDATTLTLDMRGPFGPKRQQVNYDLNAAQVMLGNGSSSFDSSFGLNTRVRGLFIGNNINYRQTKSGLPGPDEDATIDGSLTVRGRALGMAWRTTADYDIKPDTDFNSYRFNLSRRFTNQLQGEFDLSHKVDPSYSRGELSASWNGEHIVLTPSLSHDTDNSTEFMVNAHFGLSRNPYSGEIYMSGLSMASKGGVAAFVFLDKDGNNEFNDGDEMLPDAVVEAVQSNSVAYTDASGEAYLYDLPTSRITDIVVQDSSSFDLNWVPGSSGVSIRPRSGHVTRVVFPIHRGGEIDGTTYIKNNDGDTRVAREMGLYLYNGDGKLVMSTKSAPDGYYLFERIPPGKYYLVVDPDDAKATNVVRPKPQKIDITFDGTVMRDNNIWFTRGENDIAFTLAPDMGEYLLANPRVDRSKLSAADTVILNLGHYHSRLLSSLVWYKVNMFEKEAIAGGSLLAEPSEENVSAKTGRNALRLHLPSDTLDTAYDRCRKLSDRGYYCEVEILPRGVAAKG